MCVCVCVRERERVCVCVCEREREKTRQCVYVKGERYRQTDRVCVCNKEGPIDRQRLPSELRQEGGEPLHLGKRLVYQFANTTTSLQRGKSNDT